MKLKPDTDRRVTVHKNKDNTDVENTKHFLTTTKKSVLCIFSLSVKEL